MSTIQPDRSYAASSTDTPKPVTIKSGLTRRALVIGGVLAVLLNIWAIHSAYSAGSSHISSTHLPVAALFPFLVVVMLLNPALKILTPRHALNRYELIIIFFLIFTASAIPAWAFSTYWISTITGPYYYASPENAWISSFFDYLPSWLIVPDQNHAIQWFYEGLPSDQDFSILILSAWIIPLIWWAGFYFAIFIVGASVMVMLRKQWVEHERLSFPLAQIPLILVEGADERHLLPPIARKRLFWVGFALTLFLLLWNMVSYFDLVSAIPIGMMYPKSIVIAKSFPAIPMRFNFLVAAVAFFTNINVLFSICVFFLIMTVQEGIMNRLGVPNSYAIVKSQHSGGFLIFVLFSLWAARRHLRDVFLKAFGKAPHIDDSSEFFSYRKAVIGLGAGLGYIVFWLHTSGMSWGIMAFLMGSLLLMFIGVTRLVAETGLVFLDLPFEAHDFTVAVVGSGEIAPQNLTVLAVGNAYARNWRTLGMCSMGHIAKVDNEVGRTGKSAFGPIALILLVSTVTAVGYTMYLGYANDGAANFLEGAFRAGSTLPYNNLVKWMNNRQALTGMEMSFLGIGGLVSYLLLLAHHRFPWWFLHPIGFAVVKTPGMASSIAAIFVVWVVKVILLRIGGLQLFRKAIPAVMGMLTAFVLGVFLSYVVDLIWFPQTGHPVQNW